MKVKMETIKVKVLKASKIRYWYSHYIGQIFEVYKEIRFDDVTDEYYVRVDGGGRIGAYDCEMVQDPVSIITDKINALKDQITSLEEERSNLTNIKPSDIRAFNIFKFASGSRLIVLPTKDPIMFICGGAQGHMDRLWTGRLKGACTASYLAKVFTELQAVPSDETLGIVENK